MQPGWWCDPAAPPPGLRYVYRHLGLAPAQLKQLHYVLRWELLQQTGEDLLLRAKRCVAAVLSAASETCAAQNSF